MPATGRHVGLGPKPNASLKICFEVLAQLKMTMKVESEVDVRKGMTFEKNENEPSRGSYSTRCLGFKRTISPNTITEGSL